MDANFVVLALLTILAAVAAAGIRRVPEGVVCTLHRFGRFQRILPPGTHFTVPVLDQIAHRVDLVGHHVDVAMPETLGHGEVYFQILEPHRAGAVLDDVDQLVQRLAGERLQLLSGDVGEPRALASRLQDELNQRLGGMGVRVIRCRLA